MGKIDPTWEQVSFRGRNDDGSETTATFIAALNTNWTQDSGALFRIRFDILEDAGGAVNNKPFKLQYNLASGGWNDVDAASSVVQSLASDNLTDAEDTTQQLGGGGTGYNIFRDHRLCGP